jgi:hypothetical protein
MNLSSPQQVEERLNEIDRDLAILQNAIEQAAWEWFQGKRDREKARAEAFLASDGPVAEREAIAIRDTVQLYREEEASWEAKKSKLKVLEARLSVGQSILKSQGRP